MVDIATLGIRVDSRQAATAAVALDRLTPAARRAEVATKSLGVASATAGAFLRSFGLTLAGGLIARGATQFLDASTRISNALKVAGLEGGALTKVYDRLFESAQRNVAPFEALVTLYGRAALVQKELGVTTEELLGFTDKIAVALRVSGKSAGEASGALLQLSQALGSGVVRAEEFNSILEGALPIAQAAAAGLDEAGGSVARLRQLVIGGKISSEAFFRAFEAGSVILDEKVAGAELTVSQSFIRLQNVLIDTAGKFDGVAGASSALAGILGFTADVIESVGDSSTKTIGQMNGLGDSLQRLVNDPSFAKLYDFLFVGTANAPATPQTTSELLSAIGMGGATGATVKTVSLSDYASPDSTSDSAAKKAARDAERRQEQIDDVIKSLAFEQAQLGRTAREQEMFNALEAAGIDITSKYGAQIADSAGRLYDMAEAHAAAQERIDALQSATKDFIGGFLSDIRNGTNAVDALGNALNRLADKLIDMALDSAINGLFKNLTGALGGFGGGSLVGASVGVFHRGGVAGAAGTTRNIHPAYFDDAPRYHNGGIAGLRPNEVPAILERGETITPKGAGAGGITYAPVIDARGADAAAVARLEKVLAKDKAEFKSRVQQVVRDRPNGRW